ncbi:MAG: hypothetical protein M1433_00525 [Candidatus Parvarchaeota archaeon]|nr:hypothetical protein [Candidatus Parvarchaeota archaeon]
MFNKKGEMPVTEIVAIVIALVVLAIGIVIAAIYLLGGGTSIGNDILKAVSFSWLFGNG